VAGRNYVLNSMGRRYKGNVLCCSAARRPRNWKTPKRTSRTLRRPSTWKVGSALAWIELAMAANTGL